MLDMERVTLTRKEGKYKPVFDHMAITYKDQKINCNLLSVELIIDEKVSRANGREEQFVQKIKEILEK